MSKKSRFSGWINKQYGKRAQAFLKYVSQHLYRIHWSITTKLCSKMSPLFTCKILGLSLNTLAVDEKYLYLYGENLTIPIEMQLSEKQNTFSNFFSPFLKFRLSFEHFEIKDHPHSFCISEMRTLKTWLDKCLKRLFSEDPSTSNMVNVPKHC